jgi:geranylgeranyl pyrophosphate synthase
LTSAKRTVLVALARGALDPPAADRLTRLVSWQVEPWEVPEVLRLLTVSGAADAVERLIRQAHADALSALENLSSPTLGPLADLASQLLQRSH